jgi:hypothetical protein
VIDMPATGRERVAVGVLVGAAVVFVAFAIPRAAAAGLFGALTLPLVLLAADLVIAAAVLTWWYPLRPVAQGLAVFGILVHALVTLRSGPIWTRGCSGVLLLTHSWALVQLFLMTAAEDGDFDDDGEPASEPPPVVAPGEPAAIVETPVTDVVELGAPAEAAAPESPEAGGGGADSPGAQEGAERPGSTGGPHGRVEQEAPESEDGPAVDEPSARANRAGELAHEHGELQHEHEGRIR